MSHGQATQIFVAASHEVPGEQVAAAQLSPAFAKAVQFMPSKQDPVRQTMNPGTRGQVVQGGKSSAVTRGGR